VPYGTKFNQGRKRVTLKNNNGSDLESMLAALPASERQDPKRVAEVRRDLERQRGFERLQAKQRAPKGHQGDSSCGLPRVEDLSNHQYSVGYRYAQSGMLKTRGGK
jgi:hypothetical protein